EPMHEIAHDDHRRRDKSECEQKNRPQESDELALRKEPAVAEQQRRNEQQKKDIRIEPHRRERRDERKQCAANGQDDRKRERYPLRHRAEYRDGNEQKQRKLDRFHALEGKRSERRTRRREKRDFLGGRRAAEDRVAMWEASEAPDDLGVPLSPFERRRETGFVGERVKQRDRAFLHDAILAVHERYVEGPALERRQLSIKTVGDRVVGGCQRAIVARERFGRVAINIARELVEKNDARERA